MVITRYDWRVNGDLLEYLMLAYPGRTNAQYEAAYRLITLPGAPEEAADLAEELLAGCMVTDEEVVG